MTPAASVRRTIPAAIRRILCLVRAYGLYLWFALLPVLVTVIVLRRRDELNQIAAAMRQANPGWLLAGALVELAILLAIALTYRGILRRLGHRLSCQTLLAAHLQRTAIGAISPVSGPATVYVFLRHLGRRGVATDDGLLTVALRSIAGQVAFVVVLVGAIAATGSVYALPGLAVLATIALGAVAVSRWRLGSAIVGAGWTARLPHWAQARTEKFLLRARRHRLTPRDLVLPLACAVSARLGTSAILFASLHALSVPASIDVVATAFCASMLAHIATPVFQIAGVVETATAVALAHAGVPADAAVGAMLLWRLLEHWLPVLLGLILQVGWMVSKGSETVALPTPLPRAPHPLPAPAAAAAPQPAAYVRREHHEER